MLTSSLLLLALCVTMCFFGDPEVNGCGLQDDSDGKDSKRSHRKDRKEHKDRHKSKHKSKDHKKDRKEPKDPEREKAKASRLEAYPTYASTVPHKHTYKAEGNVSHNRSNTWWHVVKLKVHQIRSHVP